MPVYLNRRNLLRAGLLLAAGPALVSCAPQVESRPGAAVQVSPQSTLIVYESVYGNTEHVARAVGAVLGLDETRVRRVEQASSSDLQGVTLLLIGSPTQAFNMLPSVRDFIKRLPAGSLASVRAVAFDTRLSEDAIRRSPGILRTLAGWFGYAAEKLARALADKGALSATEFAAFTVEDTEGPLSEGELERAAKWAATLV